jgi:hypothetical protein
MVNDGGQLYTIEGIAAGMIMLFTAYLVLGATTIYTPGDSHISDMQLEQTGTDALRMMNTPVNCTGTPCVSQLQKIVENNDGQTFNTTFLDYVNNKTGSLQDNLHYEAMVTYRNTSDSNAIWTYPLVSNRNLTGVEHPVRVTEWVITYKPVPGDMQSPRVVLVEVLLWRD